MYVLCDIGGTKTRVAISSDLETFEVPDIFETPAIYDEGIAAIIASVEKMRRGEEISACVIGLRGRISLDGKRLFRDEILTTWQGRFIVEDFERAFSSYVWLVNDAALVGLGEACHGAGKGYDIVAYHTVSTGVGGVRIVHGVIDSHVVGFEPGHQTIDVDHTMCPTCEGVDLETHISGSAVERRFGKKPYDIAQDNYIWNDLAHVLSHGIKNTVLYWSPHVVVLGGSMITGKPRILLSDIRRHTEEALSKIVPCPPIEDAVLGDLGGLYGGMVYLSQKLEKNTR